MHLSVAVIVIFVVAFICFCAIVIESACSTIWQRQKREKLVFRSSLKTRAEFQTDGFNVQSSSDLESHLLSDIEGNGSELTTPALF